MNNMPRALFLLKVAIKNLIKYRSADDPNERNIIVREGIEELGSIFVKFGQIVALRQDMIPQDLSHELYKLLDQVPEFGPQQVVDIFKKEFDLSPFEIFDRFEDDPVASASLAQVHIAFIDGEKLAVKVQRPDIEKLIKQDLKILLLLTRAIDFFSKKVNKLTDLAEQFRDWTIEELDLTKELENLEEYSKLNNQYRQDVVVPKVYQRYSTSNILTMEYIEGVSIATIIRKIREDDESFIKEVEARGFDKKLVVDKIIRHILESVHIHGYFHADPHPANIIFTSDGELAFIDLGTLGRLDKNQRLQLLKYLRAQLMGEADSAVEALLSMCRIPRDFDKSRFHRDHKDIVARIQKTFEADTYIEQQKLIAPLLQESLDLLQTYKVIVPANLIHYLRAFEIVEGIIFALYPEMGKDEMSVQFRNITIKNILNLIETSNHELDYQKALVKIADKIEDLLVSL